MSYLLAILSGILVALSFPMVIGNFSFLNGGLIAWVALIPLLFAIHDEKPRKTFILTFMSSFVWYLLSLFWIFLAMYTYSGMGVILSTLCTILLVIILSTYISIFLMISKFVSKKIPYGDILWIPIFWTTYEWARNYMPCNGFPWANIGMSQWKNIPVLQLSSITGVYGVIFLIIFVNQFFATSIKEYFSTKKISVHRTIAFLIIILSILSFGFNRASTPFVENNNAIMVGAIQPNLNQLIKWNPYFRLHSIDIHKKLTSKLTDGGSTIVVWPETSIQLMIPFDRTIVDGLKDFIPPGYIVVSGFMEGNENLYYNSMYAFEYDGQIIDKYRKQQLVPFGEYVPYKNLLFFAKGLAGDFQRNKNPQPMKLDILTFGPLICYEDIFPQISRDHVNKGAEALIAVTNDGWYGRTSAMYQHLALSIFRAVENNRYLIRSGNTGVTSIIAPTGKIIIEAPILEEAVIAAPIFPLTKKTFFTKYGDWFPFMTTCFAGIGLIISIILKYRKPREA